MDLAKERRVLAANEYYKASHEGDDFSKKFEYNIPETTMYIKVISDNHNQLEPLMKDLQEASLFKNMKVLFLGDQLNTATKESKTSVFEVKPIDVEIDTIQYAIEKSGIDKDQILAYIDGNHEKRVKDITSIKLGQYITEKLGIPEKYAENQALITLYLNDPKKEGQKFPVTIFAYHGQGRGGGPGAETDKSLNSYFQTDIELAGDTHKVASGNKLKEFQVLGTNKKFTKNVFFANFGTDIQEEKYLAEKGIPPRATRDGEILKISLIPNQEKNKTELAVDFVNIRQVLTDEVKRIKDTVVKKINDYENMSFTSKKELDIAYKSLLKEVESISNVKLVPPTYKYPKKLQIAVISGLRNKYGKKEAKENRKKEKKCDDQLAEIISAVAKLEDCKVILNGDLIHYKEADLKKKTNFPQATYDYLEELANKFEPIKDKIIAINSGKNEDTIVQQSSSKHGLELAKIAAETRQFDLGLIYEPITAEIRDSAKRQIQNELIGKHNEKVLNEEFEKHYKKNIQNVEALLEQYKTELKTESDPFYYKDIKPEDMSPEDVKNILILKLRKERKVLNKSTPSGKREISLLFPLSKINPTDKDYERLGFLKPNANLVQNILCSRMDIDPKTISINSDLEDACENFVKLTNADGEVQGINILTSYNPNTKTRKSAEKRLSQEHDGTDVYITNGDEYCTKEREVAYDENNDLHTHTVWHIATGKMIKPETAFRIYEIRAEKSEIKDIKAGIYRDTDQKTITCSSKSIASALNESYEDNTSKIISNLLLRSYRMKYDEIKNRERENAMNSFAELVTKKGNATKPKSKLNKNKDGGKE